MTAYVRPWVELLRGWLRGRGELVLENAALRQQLAMYERRRPGVRDSDRLFWLLLVRFWPGWRGVLVAVRPETAVRWHQAGWPLLDVEEPTPTPGPPQDRPGGARADHAAGAGEPALGSGPYPG